MQCHLSFLGAWVQKEANTLLMLNIHIKVTHHDDATVCPDAFFAPAELTGLHIPFHDVDTIFFIKRDTGNLIKTDDIVLTDQTSLACGIIHKHFGDGWATHKKYGQQATSENWIEWCKNQMSSGSILAQEFWQTRLSSNLLFWHTICWFG